MIKIEVYGYSKHCQNSLIEKEAIIYYDLVLNWNSPIQPWYEFISWYEVGQLLGGN